MLLAEQIKAGEPIEVGYILTFGDGRKDCYGQFPLTGQKPVQADIFKKLVEIEPTTPKASYIMVNLRSAQPSPIDLDSIEYRREDIEFLLQGLAKQGIIWRASVSS